MSHPTSAPVRAAGPVQLALLLVGSCMPVLGAVLLAPVLPRMEKEFASVSGAEILVPVVLTLPALFIALGAPFAGAIADRFDRRRLLLGSMVAYSLFGTAPLYLDSLHAILASRALVGVCEAAIMTCCTTLIADYWSGRRRVRYLGVQTLVTTLSATVFFALGGALGAGGWRTVFWLYLVAALVAVPMARFLWQPATPVHEPAEKVPARRVAVPALVTVVGGLVFYTLIVQLSYVLDDAGVSDSAAIGGVTALMSLATAIGAGLFAKATRLGLRRLLAGEFALAGLGLLLVGAAGPVPVVVLGAVITGFGTGLLLPTLLTWAVDGLPFAQRGRGTGVWTSALFLGEFLSPLVVGGLAAATTDLGGALGVVGFGSIGLAILVAVLLGRSAGRHAAFGGV
ncbi:MFS transporter [Actinocorallia sp. A-T 12471]|uniref:MFS transporter n=1 Tax=Actinocorallia sp. A-T 12471 TaxID=3089813 RepID=UPI0029D14A3E|nr:MFS transporter [Actinocorallia sp. A-T 12471]MDX6739131.1 MFS transporter [Actinocorallia sp. A-T 12471]